MGIRDWFRRKPKLWEPEKVADGDEAWSPVRRGSGRQTKGRISAPLRNSHLLVGTNHMNRAGRRSYVRELQTRQVRKNIVGFGRWRRHRDRSYESHAATVGHEFGPFVITGMTARAWRSARRREYDIPTYRAARKVRSTRITVPSCEAEMLADPLVQPVD
jgi:hypothetical protein